MPAVAVTGARQTKAAAAQDPSFENSDKLAPPKKNVKLADMVNLGRPPAESNIARRAFRDRLWSAAHVTFFSACLPVNQDRFLTSRGHAVAPQASWPHDERFSPGRRP